MVRCGWGFFFVFFLGLEKKKEDVIRFEIIAALYQLALGPPTWKMGLLLPGGLEKLWEVSLMNNPPL